MEVLNILLVVFLSQLSFLPKNSASDIKKLESQLQKQNAQLQTLRNEMEVLKKQNQQGYCQIHANLCGSCTCIEDFDMVEKFYCDCQQKPARRDCKEHHLAGERINGVYQITKNIYGFVLQVFCDQTTDGGGWTVIQRRVDGSANFQRNWTEYKIGFGKLHREHWLGNQNIYLLTAQAFLKGSEVRADLIVRGGSSKLWAKYSHFEVDGERTKYELHVSGYTGNAGDHLFYHDGMKFTTYDRDNDPYGTNCAIYSNGAWWYKTCVRVNLNGVYDEFQTQPDYGRRFSWYTSSLQFSELKVRRN